MDDAAIKVENVSKVFKLPREKQSSIKAIFINLLRSEKGYVLQKALDNVSFEIKKGEFFGIVGRNGSGKSTLLKLLAGIYTPSKGNVQVNGKLTPFIELGVGFNPELTGRENVYLNGALLGFSRKEMNVMYKDIVEFAELEKFMDQKLKNYSSGMQVRLAFSIAIRAQSDILLIDEVLAVGDVAFQQKCYDYFGKIKRSGATVVFVSHDMDSIKKFCNRALVINEGETTFLGDAASAAEVYEKENEERTIASTSQSNKARKKADQNLSVKLADTKGKSKDTFGYGEKAYVELSWTSQIKPKNAGIAILREGQVVFASNTKNTQLKKDKQNLTQEIELNLGPGLYTVVAGLFEGDDLEEATLYEPHGPQFVMRKELGRLDWEGLTRLQTKWLNSRHD